MKKLLREQSGFTLVELMVVVAIIGVLSAIAVPNFKKYQAKSKTSEAKLQLSAAYTAEQSFFSDYDTYATCLQFMGFNPTNEVAQRYYAIGFATENVPGIAATNGATGCVTGAGFSFAAGKALGGTAAATVAALPASTAAEDTFTIGAGGFIDKNFDTDATCSQFTINQDKFISQVRAGY